MIALVAVLGGLGAAARFMVDGAVRARHRGTFPVGTVAVNLSGSLVLGVLAGALAASALTPTAYTVGAVGFCGGYTTFSTAMVESVRLVQSGDARRATANVLGTLALTVAAVAAGFAAAWWALG